MYNQEKFNQLVNDYKKAFGDRWPEENYKLIAVKHFQDNWNIDADDFPSMLNEALAETSNLLMSAMRFPKGMIVGYAKRFPDETKEMFKKEISKIPFEISEYDDIILLAPTGRAGKRLNEVTKHPAQTIHKFLGYDGRKYCYGEDNKVDCKFVIIDEMSMVDVLLFNALLKAFPGYEINIYPIKSESGVDEQPFGKDIYEGAKNRINYVKEKYFI